MPLAVVDTMAHGDSAAAAAAVDRLLATGADGQIFAAVYPVQLTEDLPDAIRLASWATDPRLAVNQRVFGYGVLGDLALEGGRWQAAKGYIEKSAALDPGSESELVSAALLPYIQVPREDLLAFRRRVAQWDTVPAPGATTPAELLRPHVRLYLLGALDSRLGDQDEALRAAQRLDALPAPADYASTVRGLARELRAQVAVRNGDLEQALAMIRPGVDSLSPPMAPNTVLNLELGRYWKAEILFQLGRDRDALDWFRNALKLTNHEPAFIPIIHLRCGQIYDRLGQREQAAEEYARFIHLWRDADPAQQALVAYARDRLAHLGGDRG